MNFYLSPFFLLGALLLPVFGQSLTPPTVVGTDVLSSQPLAVHAEKKSGLVLVFLSAVCPCSNSHIQELKSLAAEYPEYSFVGIHSNTDESMTTTKTYFRSIQLPFPVIQDNGAKLADQYKAFKTPHAFVINSDGKIVYRGGVSNSHEFETAEHKYLREALNDLHHHIAVQTPEGRTLGCAISRRGQNVW